MTAPQTCLVEVAVDSPHGARAALAGGAHRIELCAHLETGGLTPSHGLLSEVRKIAPTHVPIFCMVRPRGGNFLYDADEFAVMLAEARELRAAGADGIVAGCLRANASIDTKQMRALMDATGDLPLTFHRAFDRTADADAALDTLIELGIPRVLTSGQQASAELGSRRIRELHQRANGRITLLAGAGVRDHNALMIVEQTAVHEIHLSARTTRQGGMLFRRQVAMGPNDTHQDQVQTTDAAMVQRVVDAVSRQAGRQ